MGYSISVGAEQSLDEANNRSWVRAWVDLNWSNGSNWSYGSSNTWGSVTVAGTTYDFGGPKSGGGAGSGSSRLYTSPWTLFNHDANGYRGAVGTSGYFTGDYLGSFSPYNLSAGGPTFGAVDYDRRPAVPTFYSITRSGTSLTVTVNATSSPAGTPTYYVERSENGGAYGSQQVSTGRTFTFDGCAPGSTQTFRVTAQNSDGWSGWGYSSSTSVPSYPSAPASVSLSSVGTTIKLTVGASSSNGGDTGTPTYKFRYSTDGTTWSAFSPITAGVETQLTGLTPGLTYTFQAYATNSVGDSSAAIGSVLLVVGGKTHNGTDWVVNRTAKLFDFGSNTWRDLSTAQIHDGTPSGTWKVLS